MGKSLKYVKDFEFPSDKGYSGSSGQTMVKGYARGGSCNMAKGGMSKGGKMDRLKGVMGNERSEMARVEAKQRNAGQELSRVRSEMRYDKNEMKGMRKQYPTNRSEPMIAMKKGGHVSKKVLKKFDGGYIQEPSTLGVPLGASPLVQVSNTQNQPPASSMVPEGNTSLSPNAMKKGGRVVKKMAIGGAIPAARTPGMGGSNQYNINKPAGGMPPRSQINPAQPNVMGFPDRGVGLGGANQYNINKPAGSIPGGGTRPFGVGGPLPQAIDPVRPIGGGTRPFGASVNLGTTAGPGGGRPDRFTEGALQQMQQQMQQAAGTRPYGASVNLGTTAGPGGGRPPMERTQQQMQQAAKNNPQQMVRPAMAKGGMLYSRKEVMAKNLLGEGKAPPLPHAKGSVNMARGGMTGKQQAKVGKVMGEFKAGELHSGSKSGPVVRSRKQAIAIGLSEARKAKK